MSRLAAASTTPVTNANMQENSRNSLRILVAMVMIRFPVRQRVPDLGGLSHAPPRQRTPAPWPKGDDGLTSVPVPFFNGAGRDCR
jgi:hypothetical protein